MNSVHSEAEREKGDWARWTLIAVLGVAAFRLGWSTFEFAPLHFDESQYWTYGQSPDWGYYSKPPMVAWLIRLSTEIFGDTPFGVRFFSPILHSAIAWGIFATGRLLFDGRTGFWAALIYLAAPGVTVSSTLMSTDPPMMLGWTVALYALARALNEEGPGGEGAPATPWWALMGAAIGAGLLAKYTIVVFALGALGYFLFARQSGPIWRAAPKASRLFGPMVAVLVALAVFSPNLIWNAANDFASFNHVGDNAKLGKGAQLRFDKLGEFFGAQFGVFGPISLLALIALAGWGRWRHEWPFRLLLWLSLPLLIAMTLQAFLSRAHPNWAAPSYIAGSILVSAWLLDIGRRKLLIASVAIGALIGAVYLGGASYFGPDASAFSRRYDPLKKLRHYHGICERALALRKGERLMGGDRKLMADCLFAAGEGVERLRMFPAEEKGNHYLIAASFNPDDSAERAEPFLFVWRGAPVGAQGFLDAFETAEVLETGEVRTHKDRVEPYLIARVQGWRGRE